MWKSLIGFFFDRQKKTLKLSKKQKKGRHKLLSHRDQLIMTLRKLTLKTQFENLADQVDCSKTTVYDILRRYINHMYVKLKFLIELSDRDASIQTLPKVFRQYFPKLIAIIEILY